MSGEHEKRLSEIASRAAAATPGPWQNHYNRREVFRSLEPWPDTTPVGDIAKAKTFEDGDFIAAAREDIPWLLARVRELEARLAALEGSHKKLVWGAREATVDLVHLDETDAVTPDNVMTICAELSKAIAAAELPGPAAAEASERYSATARQIDVDF